MALEPAKLADFKIAGALGSGTTARVYDAVHTPTGRAVAIKVLEPSQAGREMRERFAREALLLSGVNSRHVCAILGFGFEKGQPFLVLERLHGETLDEKLRRDGPVAMPVAIHLIEQLLVGVRDCHDAHVIHRDIKPANIFLHRDGFDEVVKLIDFGVARRSEIASGQVFGGLTSPKDLIGSMGYMAPEQFKDPKAVSYPADLYAVGVVVYRTLTGELPFVTRSLEGLARAKAEQAPPRISSRMPGARPNLVLDAFVDKAMARQPEARFTSARDMLEEWWNVMASLEDRAARASSPPSGANAAADAGPDLEADEIEITIEPEPELRSGPGSGAPPEVAPPTPRIPYVALDAPECADDAPTQLDPDLRRRVQRELDLVQKRKRRGS